MRRKTVNASRDSARHAAWLLLFALSACTTHHPPVDKKSSLPQPVSRSAEPAARQRQAPVEKPQRLPDYPAPPKREHNIEED